MGAIIARYLRVFQAADPAWYYLHIACQISAYIIGVSGWGLGLKLGSESVGVVHHKHRMMGIALFCLATLQVLQFITSHYLAQSECILRLCIFFGIHVFPHLCSITRQKSIDSSLKISYTGRDLV